MPALLCCACGMQAGIELGQDEEWRKELSVSRSAMKWCDLFRAFLQRPGSSYEMTGSGVYDRFESSSFKVPIDPDVELHRRGSKAAGSPKMMWVDCQCQFGYDCFPRSTGLYYRTQHSFVIHTCCWDWIADIVIGSAARQHLDVLLASMRQLWEERYPLPPYGLQKQMDLIYPENIFCFVGEFRAKYGILPADPPFCKQGPSVKLDRKTVSMPLIDPRCIPELRTLVELHKHKNRTKKRKRPAAIPPRPIATRRSCRLARAGSPLRTSPIQSLPIDVIELLLDELSSNSMLDASNAVHIFNWKLPDLCWKRRLPLDAIIELGPPDGSMLLNHDIDWKALFVGFWRLTESSQALVNRMRIFACLRAIRDRFFKMLNECSATST